MKKLFFILTVMIVVSSCQKDVAADTDTEAQKRQLQLLSGRWNLVNTMVEQFIPAANPIPAYSDFQIGQPGDYLIFNAYKVFVFEHDNTVADTFDVAYDNNILTVYDDDHIFKIDILEGNSHLRLSMDTVLFGNRQKILSNLKR